MRRTISISATLNERIRRFAKDYTLPVGGGRTSEAAVIREALSRGLDSLCSERGTIVPPEQWDAATIAANWAATEGLPQLTGTPEDIRDAEVVRHYFLRFLQPNLAGREEWEPEVSASAWVAASRVDGWTRPDPTTEELNDLIAE